VYYDCLSRTPESQISRLVITSRRKLRIDREPAAAGEQKRDGEDDVEHRNLWVARCASTFCRIATLSVPVSGAAFTRVKQSATKKSEQMNWTSVAAKADGTAGGKFISASIKGG
jgi:hypothetical protein